MNRINETTVSFDLRQSIAIFLKFGIWSLQNVEKNLNNRPRKLLQFRTPNEEFLHLTGQKPTYALRG